MTESNGKAFGRGERAMHDTLGVVEVREGPSISDRYMVKANDGRLYTESRYRLRNLPEGEPVRRVAVLFESVDRKNLAGGRPLHCIAYPEGHRDFDREPGPNGIRRVIPLTPDGEGPGDEMWPHEAVKAVSDLQAIRQSLNCESGEEVEVVERLRDERDRLRMDYRNCRSVLDALRDRREEAVAILRGEPQRSIITAAQEMRDTCDQLRRERDWAWEQLRECSNQARGGWEEPEDAVRYMTEDRDRWCREADEYRKRWKKAKAENDALREQLKARPEPLKRNGQKVCVRWQSDVQNVLDLGYCAITNVQLESQKPRHWQYCYLIPADDTEAIRRDGERAKEFVRGIGLGDPDADASGADESAPSQGCGECERLRREADGWRDYYDATMRALSDVRREAERWKEAVGGIEKELYQWMDRAKASEHQAERLREGVERAGNAMLRIKSYSEEPGPAEHEDRLQWICEEAHHYLKHNTTTPPPSDWTPERLWREHQIFAVPNVLDGMWVVKKLRPGPCQNIVRGPLATHADALAEAVRIANEGSK